MKTRSFSTLIVRTAAVAFFSAAASLCLIAQSPYVSQPAKPLDLKASLMAPLDLSRPADLNYSSSVGSGRDGCRDKLRSSRRRHRSLRHVGATDSTNYSDRWHNADGSKKYTFSGRRWIRHAHGRNRKRSDHQLEVSGRRRHTTSTRSSACMLEYNYDKFGDTPGNLTRQFNRYNALGLMDQNGRPVSFAGLDGNTHIWSLTLNPITPSTRAMPLAHTSSAEAASIARWPTSHCRSRASTATSTASATPSRRTRSSITIPTMPVASMAASALRTGCRGSHRSTLYAEARYVWVNNQPSANSVNGLYPENNKRTGYFPVTFGIRF